MRKQVFGRKFKRDANERKALLKGLMTDLVMKESIKTTEEKAKAIRGQVEKLITKAKTRGEGAERLLQPYLTVAAVEKVTRDLAKRFANRPGGYVRIVKLGTRFGDNARMAIIEWVEKTSAIVPEVVKEVKEVAQKASSATKAAKPVSKPAKKPVAKPASTAKRGEKEKK